MTKNTGNSRKPKGKSQLVSRRKKAGAGGRRVARPREKLQVSNVTSRQLAQAQLNVNKSEAYNNSLSTTGDVSEAIDVYVNPGLLFQFLYGYLSHATAQGDDHNDYNTMLQMVRYFMSNMQTIDSVYVTSWPRPIVELAYALRPRVVGRYSYTPDWAMVQLVWATAGTNGFSANYVSSTAYQTYNTTPNADGFLPLNSAVANLTDLEVRHWLALHAKDLDLVPIIGWKDDMSDASAFAYDIANPAVPQAGSQTDVLVWAGYTTGTINAALYLPSETVVGLETRIKRPHLASLRLCTQAMGYCNITGGQTTNMVTERAPSYVQRVYACPALIGFNRYTPNRFKGRCQLKLVPATRFCQGIVNRLEAIGALMGATWTNAFGANDVKMLAFGYMKRFLTRYSGANCGTSISTAGSLFTNLGDEWHVGAAALSSLRVPEFICKYIGTQSAWVSSPGALIPTHADFSPNSLTTSLTYAGSNVSASINYSGEVAGAYTKYDAIALKYKPLEKVLALYTNEMVNGQYGGSLLDTTVLTNAATSTYLGLHSRRPLTDVIESLARSNVDALSYEYTDASNGVNLGARSDKEYSQPFRKTYCGYELLADIISIAKNDGLVTGGALTSNMSDASGTNRVPYVDPPNEATSAEINMPIAAPMAAVSLYDRVQAAVSPRHGQYCGKGWTAGQDSLNSQPPMKDGKYLVPPIDKVDAACKVHDEAYQHAGGSREKLREADKHFVDELARLKAEGYPMTRAMSLAEHWFRVPSSHEDEL